MNYPRYPEYKPSGVEWLGDVPAHWGMKRLKFATACINDKQDVVPEGLEYVAMEHIESWTAKRLETENSLMPESQTNRFKRGDVLFGKLRPYLAKAWLTDRDGVCSTELLVLRERNLEPAYLRYWVLTRSFVEVVDGSTYGSKMPRASWDFIGNVPALIPTRDEQRAIAAFLDGETARIDALIARKQRLIELLAEKRTALISQAVTKGLNPDVPMKDSGVEWLGEIPAHWEMKRVKHLLLSRPGAIKTGPFGSQLLSSEMTAGEVKVYNQRTVIDNDFVRGDNYVTQEKFDELKAFEVFSGDLLITTRGTIGRCAIVPPDTEIGILHPCLMRMQFDSRRASPRYVALLIQGSNLVRDQLKVMSNATTIEVIYSETLKAVAIPIPPVEEQETILQYLDRETGNLDILHTNVETAIEKLKEYRAALITDAVTGKIDVHSLVKEREVA